MILLDFNQIALSNIFIQKLNEENMIRQIEKNIEKQMIHKIGTKSLEY